MISLFIAFSVYKAHALPSETVRPTPFELCRHMLSFPVMSPAESPRATLALLPTDPSADGTNSVLTLSIPFGLNASPFDRVTAMARENNLRLPDGMWAEVGIDTQRILEIVFIGRPPDIARFIAMVAREPASFKDMSVAIAVNAAQGRLPKLEPAAEIVLMKENDFAASLRALGTTDPGRVKLVNVPTLGYFLARLPAGLVPIYAEKLGGDAIPEEPIHVEGLLAASRSATLTDRRPFDRVIKMFERVMRGQSRVVFTNRNKPEFTLVSLADFIKFQRLRTTAAHQLSFPHRSVPRRMIEAVLSSPTLAYQSRSDDPEEESVEAAGAIPVDADLSRRETRASLIYGQPARLTTEHSEVELSAARPMLNVTYRGRVKVCLLAVAFVKTHTIEQIADAFQSHVGCTMPATLRADVESYKGGGTSINRARFLELSGDSGSALLRRPGVCVVSRKHGLGDLLLILPVP